MIHTSFYGDSIKGRILNSRFVTFGEVIGVKPGALGKQEYIFKPDPSCPWALPTMSGFTEPESARKAVEAYLRGLIRG